MDKISFVLLLCAAASNAAAGSVMKHAYGGRELLSSGVAGAAVKILFNPWILLGIGFFGVSFFFMAAALSKTELTLAYPFMSGLVYLILLFVGSVFFGEKLTLLRVAGMAFILAGIIMLSVKNG